MDRKLDFADIANLVREKGTTEDLQKKYLISLGVCGLEEIKRY